MGGGGSYYDRDVSRGSSRGSRGYTPAAERATSGQRGQHESMQAKGRIIECPVTHPVVYSFDVTGSMGSLPKIIYDKMPMIVGQTIARGYLTEVMWCLGAIGDRKYDRAPLQIGEFDSPREMDKWMKRIYFESHGGGNAIESYEMMAYYWAYVANMDKATTPIFLITGDEGFFPDIPPDEIRKHIDPNYGGEVTLKSVDVWQELIRKFRGNVFFIKKDYPQPSLTQWQEALGEQRVIQLPSDLAIGDITLGLFAIASDSRTLDWYIEDMQTRPDDLAADQTFEPQSPERIAEVRHALAPLENFSLGTGDPVPDPDPRLSLLMDS